MSVPSYVKTYSYTPTKNLTSSQSTNYTQNRESVIRAPSSEGKYTSSVFQASYVGKDNRFRSIHERYEREAEGVHRNYEQHYREHLEMGDVMMSVQQQLEAEQKKVLALETRLSECYRELDQEKRHRLELDRKNTELRTNSRRNEALLSGYEVTVSNVQQNATGVNYENETLRQELKKLSDICNAKLREMDEKHKNEVEKLNDDLDELRSKIKEKDIDAEAKVRGVSRELEAKIRSLENQLREKDRIISESESELRSMKEYNMKTKMEFEEELRRQINIVKDQERIKPEGAVKELETKVNELDTDNEILKKKAAELAQEIKNKEKAMKDVKVKVEDQIGHLRRENIDLKDQISVSSSEIERLQLELKGNDSSVARLQNEIRALKNDLAAQKDSYLNEINRLVGKNDGDIKRFQEYERQLKARIVELERQLTLSQTETSKVKSDLERFRDHVSGNIEKTISQTFGDYGAKNVNSKYPC